MKQLLAIILYCFIFCPVFSQSSQNPYAIKGFIIDSITCQSIAFVKFSLKNLPNNKVGLLANDTDGSFTMNNLQVGDDSLSVNCIGEVAKNVTIKPNNNDQADLEMLLLIPKATELTEVTVSTAKAMANHNVVYMAQEILRTKFASSVQQTGVMASSLPKYLPDSISIVYKKAGYTWCFYVEWR